MARKETSRASSNTVTLRASRKVTGRRVRRNSLQKKTRRLAASDLAHPRCIAAATVDRACSSPGVVGHQEQQRRCNTDEPSRPPSIVVSLQIDSWSHRTRSGRECFAGKSMAMSPNKIVYRTERTYKWRKRGGIPCSSVKLGRLRPLSESQIIHPPPVVMVVSSRVVFFIDVILHDEMLVLRKNYTCTGIQICGLLHQK